jgi:hypothetical protein
MCAQKSFNFGAIPERLGSSRSLRGERTGHVAIHGDEMSAIREDQIEINLTCDSDIKMSHSDYCSIPYSYQKFLNSGKFHLNIDHRPPDTFPIQRQLSSNVIDHSLRSVINFVHLFSLG